MKHARASTRKSAVEDIRRWFELSPVATLVLDPSLEILLVSDRYLALTMTRREEIIGRPVFAVFPGHPSGGEEAGQVALRESLERVLKHGEPDTMAPLRIDVPRRADRGGGFDERWWILTNIPVLGPDGATRAILHSVEDITLRSRLESEKAAEEQGHARAVERFEALVTATHDAIWDWDMLENRIDWNENLPKAFRHDPEVMRTSEAWLAAIVPDDRQRVQRSIDRVVQDPDGREWAGEYRFVRGDGVAVHVYDRGLVLRDAERCAVRMIGSMQDVSERVETLRELERVRKEMEAALQENRHILEHSRDIISVLDEEGRFLRVSDAVRRILSYDPSELTGRHFIDFVHPEDRASTNEARARVRSGSPVTTFRNRLRRKDGTAVPLMWSSVWMPQERMSYSVGRDVTELVAAEREITRLGDHLATMLESITEGCFTVDRDWRFVYMNRRFEEFLGRSRDDLVGKEVWEELPRELTAPYRTHYRRAMEERITMKFEAHLPARRNWLDVTVHPTPDGIAILFRDITLWKLSAERLEEQAAAIDQAQDAIIIRDLDHKVRSWNASAERLYGYHEAEVVGRRVDSFLHTDLEVFSRANAAVLLEGQWSGELALHCADGGTAVVDARWSLLRRDGTPHAILAINTDLSERKRFEAQLLRVQRLESLGRLAGGIAHDLNNVLSPVLMAVSLLREATDGDEMIQETLDAMENSANRGAEMIRQVLLFARGVEGERVPVSLAGVIEELRRMIEETFPKGIRLEVRTDADVWPVLGDATQIHQVLLNLCVNARDALPAERGLLRITTENVEIDDRYAVMNPEASPGRFVRIQVSDTGTGIPPDIIEKVFEPFFTTKGVGTGTGLGLATVQGIVKSHGGWVNVYSEKGRGTVFNVYLPADLGVAQGTGHEAAFEMPRGRGELILVVDDEASIRTVTRRTLEAFGYRVVSAANGAEAIALYSHHRHEVDIVITDMMMPVMDGVALIHALRHLDPDVRIIAASGLGVDESVARAAGEGVEHFLPKPYTAETMLRLVRQVLDAEEVTQE